MARLSLALPLYLWLTFVPGSGRASIEAPPFDSLLSRAIAEAPSIEVLEARLDAAAARISAGGALGPLELELRVHSEDAPGGRSVFPELEARQRLSILGRRGAGSALARAERAGAEAVVEQARRALATTLATLYARLYAIEAEHQSLTVARELLLSLARDAGTRYAAGQGDLAAAARAEVELTHLDERILDLEAERGRVAAGFTPLFSDRAEASDWTVSSLPAVSVVVDSIPEWAVRSSAEVLVAEADVATAERRVRLMRAETAPDLTIGAGAAKPTDRGAEYTALLGIELPLFSRRGAEVDAARQDLRAAEAWLRAARARAFSEGQSEMASWRWAEAQLDLHSNRLLPQDETSFELARASYMNGRGEFSAVLDAFRAWLDDRTHRASIEADRFVTWARITELVSARSSEED